MTHITLYVCGREKLNRISNPPFAYVGNISVAEGAIGLDTYSAWFELNLDAADSSDKCKVSSYELV